jgi:hypothetical protein
MADRFYSVVAGEQVAARVTEGASTSSEAIELRVNDTVYSNKMAVLLGVRAILQYLVTKEGSKIG